MEAYRRCEACGIKSSTPHATHPYLKRSSRSYTSVNQTSITPDTGSYTSSHTDISTTDAKIKRRSTHAPTFEVQKTSGPAPARGSEELTEGTDDAQTTASKLLDEAREQLATMTVAPKDVTASEEADNDDDWGWEQEYEKREQMIEDLERRTERLLRRVVDTDAPGDAEDTSTSEPSSIEIEEPAVNPKALESVTEAQLQFTSHLASSEEGNGESHAESQASPVLNTSRPETLHQAESSAPRPPKKSDGANASRSVQPKAAIKPDSAKDGWHTLWICDFKANC